MPGAQLTRLSTWCTNLTFDVYIGTFLSNALKINIEIELYFLMFELYISLDVPTPQMNPDDFVLSMLEATASP